MAWNYVDDKELAQKFSSKGWETMFAPNLSVVIGQIENSADWKHMKANPSSNCLEHSDDYYFHRCLAVGAIISRRLNASEDLLGLSLDAFENYNLEELVGNLGLPSQD